MRFPKSNISIPNVGSISNSRSEGAPFLRRPAPSPAIFDRAHHLIKLLFLDSHFSFDNLELSIHPLLGEYLQCGALCPRRSILFRMCQACCALLWRSPSYSLHRLSRPSTTYSTGSFGRLCPGKTACLRNQRAHPHVNPPIAAGFSSRNPAGPSGSSAKTCSISSTPRARCPRPSQSVTRLASGTRIPLC